MALILWTRSASSNAKSWLYNGNVEEADEDNEDDNDANVDDDADVVDDDDEDIVEEDDAGPGADALVGVVVSVVEDWLSSSVFCLRLNSSASTSARLILSFSSCSNTSFRTLSSISLSLSRCCSCCFCCCWWDIRLYL